MGDILVKHGRQMKKLDELNYRLDPICVQLMDGHKRSKKRLMAMHKQDKGFYANYKEIARVAENLNVPPELLIDEEFYYARSGGLAAYRIAFACMRKGISINEAVEEAHAKLGFKVYPRVLYMLFQGYRNFSGMYLGVPLAFLMELCDLLEIPLSHIFRTLRATRKRPTAYSGLHNMYAMLGDDDVATMVGFGMLLATKDRAKVEEGMVQLLDWWCAHGTRKGSGGDCSADGVGTE